MEDSSFWLSQWQDRGGALQARKTPWKNVLELISYVSSGFVERVFCQTNLKTFKWDTYKMGLAEKSPGRSFNSISNCPVPNFINTCKQLMRLWKMCIRDRLRHRQCFTAYGHWRRSSCHCTNCEEGDTFVRQMCCRCINRQNAQLAVIFV